MSHFGLSCSDGAVRLERPAGVEWTEVAPRERSAPAEPLADRLAAALALAWDEIAHRVAPRARAVVVVPDGTRRFPHAVAARAVLAFLSARGTAAPRTTFLVASGVHGGDPPAALVESVSASGASLAVHGSEAPCGAVGRTASGTPVALDRRYLEAEIRIAIGGTGFHYFAGFGGGPKLVFPGVAARDGVLANHRLSLGPLPPGGLAAGCEPGRTDGNPVARDIAEAAALAPPEVALHLVPAGDGFGVECGNDGLEEARRAVRESGTAGVPSAADCVVASAGGEPLDGDLVQAHKALYHAALYARPGGAIVLAAGLARGAGSRALERWLGIESLGELERQARADYDLNAQTALSLRRICQRHPVFWLGARSPEWVRRAGAEVVAQGGSPWDAAERAARATGDWWHGAHLPVASAVVPAARAA